MCVGLLFAPVNCGGSAGAGCRGFLCSVSHLWELRNFQLFLLGEKMWAGDWWAWRGVTADFSHNYKLRFTHSLQIIINVRHSVSVASTSTSFVCVCGSKIMQWSDYATVKKKLGRSAQSQASWGLWPRIKPGREREIIISGDFCMTQEYAKRTDFWHVIKKLCLKSLKAAGF